MDMSMEVKSSIVVAILLAAALCASAFAQDVTPPTVTGITPAPGTVLTSEPDMAVITFDEPIDPATVTTSSFRLVRSGGDGSFADGNEVEIAPVSVTLDGTGTVATT